MSCRDIHLAHNQTPPLARWAVFLWCQEPALAAALERCLRAVPEISLEPRAAKEQLARASAGAAVVLHVPDGAEYAAALDLLHRLKARQAYILCVLDGDGHGDLGGACRVLLAGADHVLARRSDGFEEELTAAISVGARKALAGHAEKQQLRELMRKAGFVGESPESLALFRDVRAVSGLTGLPVLITGETGTGKELVANAVHTLDERRRHHALVSLNCAALPESLFESELFGHARGAFTGADRERPGLLRQAHGGMLFLDEIGELSLNLQAKLLRILQTGMVRSIGADKETPVDVRILAATNRNLEQMAIDGTFREDLLHRINVLSLRLRPLRERPGDIGALVRHYLCKHQDCCPGGAVAEAGEDFLHALETCDLPGNARQLENLVCRALVQWEGRTPLSLKDLPQEIWQSLVGSTTTAHGPNLEGAADLNPDYPWNLKKAMQRVESLLVEKAVRASAGNQSQAARLLGITPRSVYNKLHARPSL